MITSLDIIEGKEHREHAAQLEHFQISINQLQTHVEWCEDMLLRKKSVEILQTQNALIGRCKGLLNAEKPWMRMGSHVHDWVDYNGVAFSIELLEWGSTFSDFLG